MPRMVFPAPCAACGAEQKFIEFKVEPCSPSSEVDRKYGFRCMACRTTVESVVDAEGRRHHWVEGKHLDA